jgi:restriction endonuclease S subunit
MIYSIIQKSQLEGAHRLDAEYYQPEYLKIAENLRCSPYRKLSEVVSNIINGDEIREYVDEDGLPYLRVSDIKEFFIDLSSVVYISKESKIKQNIKLREGDILLSRSGSLGIAAVAMPDLSNSIISSHLMRIPVKNINPYFLVAFLNSKFGKSQIMQRNNGAVVPEINHPSLRELIVPIFPEEKQREIENLVKSAYGKIQESNKIYFQAEDLLLAELGLKDFKIVEDLSFVVNLSDIKFSHRFDSDYFQPKYEKLVKIIKKNHCEQLGMITKRVKIKINPDLNKLYRYIEISDINVGSGDANFNEIIGRELPPNARIPIKGGELLISKVRPTRNAISILPINFNQNFICSTAFSVFNVEDILKEYLFVILRSFIGRLQFEKPTTGTEYPTITDEDVENIVIPILPKFTQQKIADLVRKSHEARKRAKELLEEAKHKVEKMISEK